MAQPLLSNITGYSGVSTRLFERARTNPCANLSFILNPLQTPTALGAHGRQPSSAPIISCERHHRSDFGLGILSGEFQT